MIEHFGGRDEDEGMPDAMMKVTNDAQDTISAWLFAGDHTKGIEA